jgi:hypothetical protein
VTQTEGAKDPLELRIDTGGLDPAIADRVAEVLASTLLQMRSIRRQLPAKESFEEAGPTIDFSVTGTVSQTGGASVSATLTIHF